jgi:polyisoprenoid-binding protein YceI
MTSLIYRTLALALAALPIAAMGADSWRSTSASLSYRAVHKLHAVEGKSSQAEAVAVIEGHRAQVMARVPVTSFDSGNANRDAHVLEALEASKHPLAVYKGVVGGFALPQPGSRSTHRLAGELELHGVKRPLGVELTLEREGPSVLIASFRFEASLEAHGVERPSLMFIQVNDGLAVEGRFRLEPKP